MTRTQGWMAFLGYQESAREELAAPRPVLVHSCLRFRCAWASLVPCTHLPWSP